MTNPICLKKIVLTATTSIACAVVQDTAAQGTPVVGIVEAAVACFGPSPPSATPAPPPPVVFVGQPISIQSREIACELAGERVVTLTYVAVPTLSGALAASMPMQLTLSAAQNPVFPTPPPPPVNNPPAPLPTPVPFVIAGQAIFNAVGLQQVCASVSFPTPPPIDVQTRTYVTCAAFNVVVRPLAVPLTGSLASALAAMIASISLFWWRQSRGR